MDADQAHEILQRSNLQAKKRLGQNFLIDEEVLEDIVLSADLQPTDTVIEVGPGLGVLTAELARRTSRVIAVEIDESLLPVLRRRLAEFSNITFVQGNVLDLEPATLLASGAAGRQLPSTYKVVANIPYYITSVLLRHFLEADLKPKLLVLMVQKEVAQRIVARPGQLSLLAVSVQVYGRPEIVRTVPATSFYPAPNVDSAILRIEVYPKPAVDVDLEKFFQVVSAGFAQPRKQLHNSLSRILWFPPGGAAELLEQAGIDPTRRAQTLTLDEWTRLTKAWLQSQRQHQVSG